MAKKQIQQYDHADKERANNPQVGLVTPVSDPDRGEKKIYQYDPHLDPQLQWAGKAEHTSFEVPTVSLHVHERIDPKTIIETVQKEKDDNRQLSLFEINQKPLREAIDFYKHKEGWTNRLIAGDSLLVMNSLLEKESMAGKVQMVYFDPPYGIKYGSNFQPFVNKRDVKDGKDDDLSAEPETIKAFRDTWELGIHSYLTYLRDRLLLVRELLSESGSVFVQISDENVHHVREIMDEVFGTGNFVSLITVQKTSARSAAYLAGISDYLLMYAQNKSAMKFRPQYRERFLTPDLAQQYQWLETAKGQYRRLAKDESENPVIIPKSFRLFRPVLLTSSHEYSLGKEAFIYGGKEYLPGTRYWSTSPEGLARLAECGRLFPTGNTLNFKRYLDDFAFIPLADLWNDTATGGGSDRYYVVQTTTKVLQRCLLMTTDPGDLVLDITCGSGTTAYVAEQWGRRWMTCDTSRVALTLAKQRLMTANFDYYQLAHPKEGVSSGFVYKTVPHITLKSIANNEPPVTENLYDQPLKEKGKTRITGPFTVEAVPAPTVLSFEMIADSENQPETENSQLKTTSISRSGETFRQSEWREELLRTGVRAKSGQIMKFSRLEPMCGTRYIQCEGEILTADRSPLKTLVVFGPEHAPLEQRMVENALDEARYLKPDILLFCAFQFDEEAAKDIAETPEQLIGFKMLKAQMNADLLTEDLRKKRSSNESFWLVGQPDVRVVNRGEWLVDSKNSRILFYSDCKELSGLDSLAEISRIDKTDLCLYAAISQRRTVWTGFTNAKGNRINSLQHSGGTGAEHDRGIQTLSGDFQRLFSRIGDIADTLKKNEFSEGGTVPAFIERLRGDKQITEWIAQITIHSPLSTRRFCQIEVLGFDYYNPKTGDVESGGKKNIALWMLDTDYDNRSLFPSQIFFPMAGAGEGWDKLAKNLRAEIDEEKIEAFKGTVSLPFKPGKSVAVKIIDDRGIESLRVLKV